MCVFCRKDLTFPLCIPDPTQVVSKFSTQGMKNSKMLEGGEGGGRVGVEMTNSFKSG